MVKKYYLDMKDIQCYFSLLSVMVNTPKQFQEVPSLKYVTYCVDIVCLIFFVAEMITKIKHMGLVGTEKVMKILFQMCNKTFYTNEHLK